MKENQQIKENQRKTKGKSKKIKGPGREKQCHTRAQHTQSAALGLPRSEACRTNFRILIFEIRIPNYCLDSRSGFSNSNFRPEMLSRGPCRSAFCAAAGSAWQRLAAAGALKTSWASLAALSATSWLDLGFILCQFGPILRPSWTNFGQLGIFWAIWNCLWPSWAHLGPS